MMWLFILGGALAAAIAAGVFLITRVRKFRMIQKIAGECKAVQYALSAGITASVFIVFYILLGMVNTMIIAIYLALFFVLSEIVIYVLGRQSETVRGMKCYSAGILAVALTVLDLGYGYYNDRHVVLTQYALETEKDVTPLRIAMFSDSHMGSTFTGEQFGQYVDEINALNPDLVVIAGDFRDGDSSYEDTVDAVKELGRLESVYGTYFVYGNHDKSHYGEDEGRSFTTAEFNEMLQEQGVIVMEDDIAVLPNGYTIIGRRDKQERGRKSIAELMQDVSEDSFVIDLNHQPNDYDNEQKAGVDLVLSGHTHGGQLWLIRDVGLWIHANDRIYGYEKRGDTNYIVSSGISDWAIDFKTGCVSEIVLVEIRRNHP